MGQLKQAEWIALAAILIAVLLIAWWLYRRATVRNRVRHRAPDALDEGAAPARRNQALIDAPSATAAALAGAGPDILGGIGEIAAVEAADEVRAAMPPPPPLASPPAGADDLTLIKGVGPKLVALLAGLGITRFDQIAGWSEADVDRIDAQLGTFAGRIRRDGWIEQCGYLAAGDHAGFEAKYGKL